MARFGAGWSKIKLTRTGATLSRGDKRSEHAIMIDIHYGAPGLMTRYGLFALLRIKQKAVARARDQASSLHSSRPITSAKKLREFVHRSGLDMATVARDIEALVVSRKTATHLVANRSPSVKVNGGTEGALLTCTGAG
jgi:hypothetical protein